MRAYTVAAHNWATASENKIHNDDVARRYGFAGGLVPGVALFAYMTHPAVEAWGRRWLDDGAISTRFNSPVYEGELVTVTMGEDGQLELRNADEKVCATGTATVGAGPAPDAQSYAYAPAPDVESRPAASPESLAPGTVLATITGGFHADRAGEYLTSVRESHPVYETEGVAHPGYLLLAANTVLTASVRLGPWIHVESEVLMFGAVGDGATVTTQARVDRTFERGGHRFVELAVLVTADGRPAMQVRHTAIYEPKRAG